MLIPIVSLFTADARAQPSVYQQPPAYQQAPVYQEGQPQAGATVYQSNGLPIGVPETTTGYFGEPLQRYDARYPWLHGYIQEIPAYEGYGAFRPYNYKHIFSQSQAAGGWGMPANLPYSQQFWHRYRQRARMVPQHHYSTGTTPGYRSTYNSSIQPSRFYAPGR